MRPLFDSLVLLPQKDAREAGFSVVPNTRSLYSVRLWGPLELPWADRLAVGLSALGLSILNGFARQDGAGRWGAEFLITPIADGPDPVTIDYLALTRTDIAAPAGGPIVLHDYALDGSPEQGAVLYLAVRGSDRVGFLGALIRSLASLGLVPREMTISTCNGVAFDRFLLQTAGGRLPSDALRQKVATLLEGMVARRTWPRETPVAAAV
jgi:hypothetical protein